MKTTLDLRNRTLRTYLKEDESKGWTVEYLEEQIEFSGEERPEKTEEGNQDLIQCERGRSPENTKDKRTTPDKNERKRVHPVECTTS